MMRLRDFIDWSLWRNGEDERNPEAEIRVRRRGGGFMREGSLGRGSLLSVADIWDGGIMREGDCGGGRLDFTEAGVFEVAGHGGAYRGGGFRCWSS